MVRDDGMHRKEFVFDRRDEGSIDAINAWLADKRLSEVSFEEIGDYLATERHMSAEGKELSVSYRYGFDRCVLAYDDACGGDAFCYQLDVQIDADGSTSPDGFHDLWSETHPDRTMRMMQCYDYSGVLVYLVLHHEKIQN